MCEDPKQDSSKSDYLQCRYCVLSLDTLISEYIDEPRLADVFSKLPSYIVLDVDKRTISGAGFKHLVDLLFYASKLDFTQLFRDGWVLTSPPPPATMPTDGQKT
jgi:hypothetical protein